MQRSRIMLTQGRRKGKLTTAALSHQRHRKKRTIEKDQCKPPWCKTSKKKQYCNIYIFRTENLLCIFTIDIGHKRQVTLQTICCIGSGNYMSTWNAIDLRFRWMTLAEIFIENNEKVEKTSYQQIICVFGEHYWHHLHVIISK